MADKTVAEEELSRQEAADRLRELADAIDGEGDAEVSVGNKRVSLSPGSTIGYEVGIRERSSILGGSREGVRIELDWKS